MKRSIANTPVNSLNAWSDFARTMGEMWWASAEVIAHRTTRMALAGPAPGARDRKEFTRMAQEKVEASAASARSMAAHMTRTNLEVGARAFRHLVAANAALVALMSSRSVSQSVARQAALARSIVQSANSAVEFSDSAMNLARHGIKPIHARATANAKRLRGR